jgi:pyridoxamine 5'-phosphate oxidase family protein
VRALVVLVDVAIVLLVTYLVYSGVTALTRDRRSRLRVGGRWRPRHYADDGHTVVAVARMTPAGEVLEEHVVARILDSDSDWSRKFLHAKEEAEERAFHLNAGGSS